MKNLNIYVLMDQQGRIPEETLREIHNNLDNELAKKHIAGALKYGFEELKNAHVHILEFGNLEMYCVKASNTTARNTHFKVEFINQMVHDFDGMQKLSYMAEGNKRKEKAFADLRKATGCENKNTLIGLINKSIESINRQTNLEF